MAKTKQVFVSGDKYISKDYPKINSNENGIVSSNVYFASDSFSTETNFANVPLRNFSPSDQSWSDTLPSYSALKPPRTFVTTSKNMSDVHHVMIKVEENQGIFIKFIFLMGFFYGLFSILDPKLFMRSSLLNNYSVVPPLDADCPANCMKLFFELLFEIQDRNCVS